MTFGQALLQLIVSDGLVAVATPLANFGAAEAAANGDPIKLGAAAIALEANLFAAAPTALGGLETQLATALTARVAAKVAGAPAEAQAALAVLAGTTPAT